MSKIKCPQCENICKTGPKFCPNCGGSLEEGEVIADNKSYKKIIVPICALVVVVLVVLVGYYGIYLNLNPIDKYQSLLSQGKVDEADKLYNDKISSSKDLVQQLQDEENESLQEIYDKYVNKTYSYEDATKKIEPYIKSTPSITTATKYQNDIDSLKKSREAYNAGVKAENENDIDTAITKYMLVIEADENYEDAQTRMNDLQTKWKNELLTEAENYATNKQYKEAIETINKITAKNGDDGELSDLVQKYTKLKNEQYVKVECVNKTVTPRNTSKWIFSDYVNFVFEVTNNSDKPIKGIEGVLTVNDIFGKEILSMGCDFTGTTIQPGQKYTESHLSFEVNEFIDDHMKLYNTDYKDMQFIYEVSSIVYTDGSTVVPK